MPASLTNAMDADQLILEGLVTTLTMGGGAGSSAENSCKVNVSPMGPLVDRERNHFVLRPYQTSRTYQNLKQGSPLVFHVTDNVQMIAEAITGKLVVKESDFTFDDLGGAILKDCCQWFALRVISLDDQEERTTIRCEKMASGRARDFFGFNRAKHAVLEAAILATRTDFLPADQILRDLAKLEIPVGKTAGAQERYAFDLLTDYVTKKLAVAARDAEVVVPPDAEV